MQGHQLYGCQLITGKTAAGSVIFKGLFISMTTEKVKTLGLVYVFSWILRCPSCYLINNSYIITGAETASDSRRRI